MTDPHFDPSFAASAAESYERWFVPAIGRPVAEDLVEVAAPRAGERALDVGCGTGIVARRIAGRVGPEGTVAGLDPNPAMLAVARSVAPPEAGIEWHEASAEAMPLPDGAFDLVTCQMSLQFVPDRAAAAREMRRVLDSGGRLALNVPGPASPVFEALAEAMGRHVSPEAAGFVGAVFGLHDEAEIAGLLEDAGFREVETRATTRALPQPAPTEFFRRYVASTPLSAIVAGAGEEARSALERDVVEAWEPFAEGDGMTLRQRLVTATAHR